MMLWCVGRDGLYKKWKSRFWMPKSSSPAFVTLWITWIVLGRKRMVYPPSLHPLHPAGGILCGWESVVRASAGHHKSCCEATMHMGIFSGRESPLSWPNESRTSWDMGPHGTTWGRSFSLPGWCGGIGNHLQAGGVPLPIALTGPGRGMEMYRIWKVINGVHRDCGTRNMINHRHLHLLSLL